MGVGITQNTSPPKVNLTLRVGVTGHRPNGLEASKKEDLESRLDFVLSDLKRIVSEINAQGSSYFAAEEPKLRLISPLAEGADVIAAESALRCGYELQCALPFSREEYEKDFKSEEAVKRYRNLLDKADKVFELDGSRGSKSSREESYQVVGHMVLDQCDILIAVWDGKDARGKGGTGQIVNEALKLEIPVLWIHSAPEHEIKLLTWNEEDENKKAELTELKPIIKELLLPKYAEDSKIRDLYFSEIQRKNCFGVIFEIFCDFFSGEAVDKSGVHVEDFEKKTREDWGLNENPEVLKSGGFADAIQEQIDEKLLLHYSWADNLAKYYSNLYRSSFVTNYLLAGLAVFFALMSVTVPGAELLWIFFELILIVTILSIVIIGNQKRWHDRWIDYRLLSEEIRQLRFLAPLGLTTPVFRVPAHDTHGDPRGTWVSWHFRAIVRELGMINARVDNHYLKDYRAYISNGEIRSQIEYHENNYPRFHKIHERLHITGNVLFALVLIAVLVHIVLHTKWLTLLVAVFPAFGAAFYGIRTQAEFEQIAKRSWAMSTRLKEIKRELDSPEFNITYRGISEQAKNAAQILSSETLDWRIVFQSKRLVLPV